jgi:hypothetical protein
MQYGHGTFFATETFETGGRLGAVYKRRFNLIAGISALSFLVLGGAEILIFLGGADILAFLFSHSHSAADLPFQLQTIAIAGLCFGLCILAVSLAPAV